MPATAPTPEVEPTDVYVHNTSKSRFGVISLSKDRVIYSRFGDGATFELSTKQFNERLRKATVQEIADLTKVQVILKTLQVPANEENIGKALRGELTGGLDATPTGDGGEEAVLNGRNPSPAGEVGELYSPSDLDVFERLILYPNVESDIEAGLKAIENHPHLEIRFALSEIESVAGKKGFNFYGEPGTGKTAAARALAKRLGRPVYQVVYSSIVSKYLGDTAKAISLAFKRADEEGAVLFFDEGDALLSRRLSLEESCATSINQNRIVLMQEMDKFGGVVIYTTNHFGNYDPAMLRRIAKHVEFKLPDAEMRVRIFDVHLPKKDYVRDIDWEMVAAATDGFSGGDIKTTVLNAIELCAMTGEPETWFLEESHILRAAYAVRESKIAHLTGSVEQPATKTMTALPATVQKAIRAALQLGPATPDAKPAKPKGRRGSVRD